ncbi:MAG: hypothetical protein HY300_20220 [Verrucomicrobia bacterium]|nr:hypothetical protein [Verrucomicrobiota bacterium]
MAVHVIPELGAKIGSLKNRRNGREWMWSPPGGVMLRRNKTGDPFPENTLSAAELAQQPLASGLFYVRVGVCGIEAFEFAG